MSYFKSVIKDTHVRQLRAQDTRGKTLYCYVVSESIMKDTRVRQFQVQDTHRQILYCSQMLTDDCLQGYPYREILSPGRSLEGRDVRDIWDPVREKVVLPCTSAPDENCPAEDPPKESVERLFLDARR